VQQERNEKQNGRHDRHGYNNAIAPLRIARVELRRKRQDNQKRYQKPAKMQADLNSEDFAKLDLGSQASPPDAPRERAKLMARTSYIYAKTVLIHPQYTLPSWAVPRQITEQVRWRTIRLQDSS
jgi:hypothetical protein